MKRTHGKATVIKSGDVTTVRVVNYHGRPPDPPRDLAAGMPAPPPDLDTLKHLDLITFNTTAEQAFVVMLTHLCDRMPDGVPILGARAEAAYRLGISTETVKRYIEKYCYAFSAPFTVRDGFIYRKEVSNGN